MKNNDNIIALYVNSKYNNSISYYVQRLLKEYNTENTIVYDIYIDHQENIGKEYSRMLNDMKDKKFNTLCIMSVPKLSHQYLVLYKLLEELKINECSLVSYFGKVNTSTQGFGYLNQIINISEKYNRQATNKL